MAKQGTPQAQTPPGWPVLGPEDRMSACVDYRTVLGNYDELVAAEGEEQVRESLDYLFYFLDHSYALLDEPEFRDLRWSLEPHDYLVYELYEYIDAHQGTDLEGIGPLLPDPRVLHMVSDGLDRYTTPALRRDIAGRAQDLIQRLPGTVQAAMAQAVQFAAEDPSISPLLVGLLVQSFRRTLLDAVLDLPELIDREWEARDRSLDRWREAIYSATPDHLARDAVAALQAAGSAALPQVQRIYYDTSLNCGDQPFGEALEVAAAIPSALSFWLLRQTLVDCPLMRDWVAEQMAAQMPAFACAYFNYLLTAPEPPDADLAVAGLGVIVAAHCPDAPALAVDALHYHVDDAEATERVQVAAWEAVLALGDPEAILELREYLADEQASARARDLLVEALQSGRGREVGAQVLQSVKVGAVGSRSSAAG